MDGEYLKVHCKYDSDFRKTQAYLDSHAIAYTTLSPNELRPCKVCVRGTAPCTDPQLIIDPSTYDCHFKVKCHLIAP